MGAKPKKEDMTYGHVFLFAKAAQNRYFYDDRKMPPAGRPQIEAQRQRVRFGSEEQQNERAMSFDAKHKKLVASDMSLVTSWYG